MEYSWSASAGVGFQKGDLPNCSASVLFGGYKVTGPRINWSHHRMSLKKQSRVSIGIVLAILLTLAYVAFGATLWLSGAHMF